MDLLTDNRNYLLRLKTFRNKKILPDEYVEVTAIKLREHVIDPDTVIIKGTYGKRREARQLKKIQRNPNNKKLRPFPHRKGYILLNKRTKLMSFYDTSKGNNRLITYFITSKSQEQDILNNRNVT